MYFDAGQMRTLWPSVRGTGAIATDLEGTDCDGDSYDLTLRLSSDGKWIRASGNEGHFHFQIKALKKALKTLDKQYKESLPQVDVEEPS